MTIVLGWWLIPLLVTLVSFGLAWWLSVTPGTEFDSLSFIPFGLMIDIVYGVFCFGGATIISLIAWVIYFALT